MNISSTLKSTFGRTKCIIAFCKNLSLKQVIGTNTPEKQLKNLHTNKNKSEKKTFIMQHNSISMLQTNNTQ